MSKRPRISHALIGVAAVVLGLLAVVLATGRLDGDPPTLDGEGLAPQAPISGVSELRFRAADGKPGLAAVTVAIDEGEAQVVELGEAMAGDDDSAPISNQTMLVSAPAYTYPLDTTTLEDGPHTAVVVARDRSLLRNRTDLHVTFVVDNTPPVLQVARESLAVRQGDTACVVARADEPLQQLELVFPDRTVPFFPAGDEGVMRALAGIGVKTEAGPVAVELVARDRAGNEARRSVELQVTEVAFEVGGYIALSGAQEKAQKDQDRGKQANAKRGAAYGIEAPEQHWDGAFGRPAKGPVTSPFGKFRTYSSGVKRHHLGVDISNATGTPVVAPADGVVTLAEELHIYGNAVILSHGHGVSSSYNHLATIEVEVGQQVQRGQRLATMGSTGQSTGPHLHWGMVAGGVAVDPEQFTREDFDVSGYDDWF